MHSGSFIEEELHLITGGAGFIGSHLTDLLLSRGFRVLIADDLSMGRTNNLPGPIPSASLDLVEADLATGEGWNRVAGRLDGKQPDMIWHLAANSDISAGVADADVDLSRTFQTTYEMLRFARTHGVRKIAFSSTSAVYGELDETLDEASGPLHPVSNYGAMKLASEAILSAATSSFIDQLWIFRFPNVIGPRATHGVIYDFCHKLKKDPSILHVLGNGTQCKPYLHVAELVDAMWFITTHSSAKVNCYMIGPSGGGTSVRQIAELVVAQAGNTASIAYGEGNRGWVGDVPRFDYRTDKLAGLGWTPKLTSTEAVQRAVAEIHGEI